MMLDGRTDERTAKWDLEKREPEREREIEAVARYVEGGFFPF